MVGGAVGDGATARGADRHALALIVAAKRLKTVVDRQLGCDKYDKY